MKISNTAAVPGIAQHVVCYLLEVHNWTAVHIVFGEGERKRSTSRMLIVSLVERCVLARGACPQEPQLRSTTRSCF